MKLQRLFSSSNKENESLNKTNLVSGIGTGIGAGTILSEERKKISKINRKYKNRPEVLDRYVRSLKKNPLKSLSKSKNLLIGTGLAAGSGYLIGKEIAKPKVQKDAIEYVKKNPDEAGVLVSSNVIPSVLGSIALKKGHKKLGGALIATTALPIGESYIAGKKIYQKMRNKKKEVE